MAAAAPAGPRTDLNLDEFRRILTEERARLADDVRRIDQEEEEGEGAKGELAAYDQHDADQGTELFQREQDLAIEASLKTQLDGVEAALRKLDAGTYGYCERCGQPIAAERLEALPGAIFCFRCADELEGTL